MRHILTLVSTAALLALAAPLAAQETETPAPDAPAETPAPADGTGLDLDMGEEAAPEGPAPGQFYLRSESGDWAMRCLNIPDQADPCELYQLLEGADGNAVAEVSIFPLTGAGEAVAGATIVAPLETLLTEGLTLSVDGGPAKQYEFSFCNRAGCVARIGLTEADIAGFKGGSNATLRIVPAADPAQPFDLTISLAGFTAGFDGSSAYDPEAPDEAPDEAAAEAPAEGN